MKALKVTVFALFFSVISFGAAFAEEDVPQVHKRSSWYIGFGLGAGLDARYKVGGEDISFDDWFKGAEEKDSKVALNFKVGATLSPKTLLGFDITSVGQTGKDAGRDLQLQINNYFLMLTHFPAKEGFFVRGGGGLSNIMNKIGSDRDTVHGFGILGGVGYAFWLGKSFNLTLNIDHSRQYYDSGTFEPDRSQFTSAYVGFDWY